MERRLVLNVLHVSVGPVLEEELAQFAGLNRIDEARSAVVVRPLNVGPVRNEQLDDVEVRHEAGRSDGSRTGVRDRVNIGAVPDENFDNFHFAGNGRTPQRRHCVHGSVFRDFVETSLLDVDAAVGQQVVNDLHVTLLAGGE